MKFNKTAIKDDENLDSPFVSILIPFKFWNDEVADCISACQKQTWQAKEIILLPDYTLNLEKKLFDCIVLPTKEVFPGEKRNIGFIHAKGSIIAFIDSDAIPENDWIAQAIACFEDTSVAIVGGTNLLPANASNRERAAWEILSSPILSGSLSARYRSSEEHLRNEVQSSNMFIRAETFEKLNGFRTDLLTAEDTDLCFRAINIGLKILYSPKVKVYHRPRALFLPFFKQMFQYGADQLLVISILPVSKTILWYLPALWVICLFLTIPLIFITSNNFSFAGILSYASVCALGAIWHGSQHLFLTKFVGAMGMYIFYGVGFIYSYFNLKFTLD